MVMGAVLLFVAAAILTAGSAILTRGRWTAGANLPGARFLPRTVTSGADVAAVVAVLVAAARGQTAVAAGMAFGLVALFAGLGLGAAVLLGPAGGSVPGPGLVLLPIGALLISAITVHDLVVTRVEGFGMLGFFIVVVSAAAGERRPSPLGPAPPRVDAGGRAEAPLAVRLAVGAALVLGGAILLTTGAVRVATRGTLSAGTTGALLAGVLAGGYRTATEVLAVRRGGADPAAGGLFVSAATFALGVPGAAAIIRPLTIDSGASTAFIAASVISALAATVLMARQRAGRTLGVALIGLYAVWIVLAPRF